MTAGTPFAGAAIAGAGAGTAAAAAPSGLVVEVEFTTGAWTDVTAPWTQAGSAVTVKVGRSSAFDDVQPGTASLTLDNDDGRFTPGNPLSPYWPNVRRGIRLRIRYTRSGTTWTRHLGRVVEWKPVFPDGSTAHAYVTIASADLLAQCAGRVLRSDICQAVEGLTWYQGAPKTWDFLTFTDEPTATSLVNASGGPSATVVPQSAGRGSVSVATAPDDLICDGVMTFTPDDGAGITAAAPVVMLRPQVNSRQQMGFFFRRTDPVTPGATNHDILVKTFTATGAQYWSLGLGDTGAGTCDLVWIYPDGLTSLIVKPRMNDGAWHSVVCWKTATGFQIYVDGQYVALITAYFVEQVDTAVYGGNGNPAFPGKNNRCSRADLAAIWWTGCTIGGIEFYARPMPGTWRNRANELWFTSLGLVPHYTITGSDARLVARRNQAGRTLLDVASELMRTVGGTLWADYGSGGLRYLAPDAARSQTVALTVDVDLDMDATGGMPWSESVDQAPTRVTASSPAGSAVAVDVEAEAEGERREETVETTAATVTAALDVASQRLNRSTRLRPTQVALDLTTATTDRWTAAMTMAPGGRIRLPSLPSAVFGVSQVDGYAQGWTEVYGPHGSVMFTFDLDAADSPAEALFDDATLGRFAAGDSMSLTSSLTSGATSASVTTLPGYPTLSTSSGDYPLDLDISGERVTVSSAPAGSSSPQTITIVRGVAPSAARAHAAGEPVEVYGAWLAAPAFAF